jgi:hypothetical protein
MSHRHFMSLPPVPSMSSLHLSVDPTATPSGQIDSLSTPSSAAPRLRSCRWPCLPLNRLLAACPWGPAAMAVAATAAVWQAPVGCSSHAPPAIEACASRVASKYAGHQSGAPSSVSSRKLAHLGGQDFVTTVARVHACQDSEAARQPSNPDPTGLSDAPLHVDFPAQSAWPLAASVGECASCFVVQPGCCPSNESRCEGWATV